MNKHIQVGTGQLQSRPWEIGPQPWQRQDGTVDHHLKNVYEANSSIILRRHLEGNVCSVYIFPLNNNFSISKIMQAANEIYYRQNNAFR